MSPSVWPTRMPVLAAGIAVALTCAVSILPAQAADTTVAGPAAVTTVTAVVVESVGVEIRPDGSVAGAGTVPYSVTREFRGDTEIVTITPR